MKIFPKEIVALICISVAFLFCKFAATSHPTAGCGRSLIQIDPEKWEAAAKDDFAKTYDSFNEDYKNQTPYLRKSIEKDIELCRSNRFFESTIERAKSAISDLKEAQLMGVIDYAFEGETPKQIAIVLWLNNGYSKGVFIDAKDSLHIIADVGHIYRQITKLRTITKSHSAILGSRIIVTEIDCKGQIDTKFILEPDYNQETMIYNMLTKSSN
jgi:hypothetical protein